MSNPPRLSKGSFWPVPPQQQRPEEPGAASSTFPAASTPQAGGPGTRPGLRAASRPSLGAPPRGPWRLHGGDGLRKHFGADLEEAAPGTLRVSPASPESPQRSPGRAGGRAQRQVRAPPSGLSGSGAPAAGAGSRGRRGPPHSRPATENSPPTAAEAAEGDYLKTFGERDRSVRSNGCSGVSWWLFQREF